MSEKRENEQNLPPDPNLPGSVPRRYFGVALSRQVVLRVGLAIALVVVSIFTDRQFLLWGLIASLAVLLIPLGRARYFVAGIVPYAAAWFVFSFLRSFADETLFAKTLNLEVLDFERWLFDGEIPTIRLQAALFDSTNLAWWDWYFVSIHWSYFLVPHGLALWVWWRSKREFQHYLAALTMTLFLGLVIYFVIPTNPPWMAPEAVDSPIAPSVTRIMNSVVQAIPGGKGLYDGAYKVVGESNPIAAMPSMHFGITFILVWVARGRGFKWEFLAWFYSLSMGATLVYLGEHYVTDIVVGGMVTTYSWFATRAWINRHAADPESVTIDPDDEEEPEPSLARA